MEIAPAALAPLATAEPLLPPQILPLLAQDTQDGVRLAASALLELRVVEIHTLNSTILMDLMMLASGRLTA